MGKGRRMLFISERLDGSTAGPFARRKQQVKPGGLSVIVLRNLPRPP